MRCVTGVESRIIRAVGDGLDEAVREVERGDASAFGRVVAATRDRLFRAAARIVGSTEEAEDVLQESYLRAYESLRAGRFDRRATVESWLFRIVANASIDALRRRPASKLRLVEADASSAPEAAAGTDPEARAALRELDGWLRDLPADQRAAFVLKEIEGRSAAEIAAALGCSEGAVEQRLVRARATLRQRSGE